MTNCEIHNIGQIDHKLSKGGYETKLSILRVQSTKITVKKCAWVTRNAHSWNRLFWSNRPKSVQGWSESFRKYAQSIPGHRFAYKEENLSQKSPFVNFRFCGQFDQKCPKVVSPMLTRHVRVHPPTCHQHFRTKIFDLWRHVTSEIGSLRYEKSQKVNFSWFLTSAAPEVVSRMLKRAPLVHPPKCHQQLRTKKFDLWRHVTSVSVPQWRDLLGLFGLENSL